MFDGLRYTIDKVK